MRASLVLALVLASTAVQAKEWKPLPTIALGIGLAGEEEMDDVYFTSWLGVKWQERTTKSVRPFAALGLEIDIHGEESECGGCSSTRLEAWPVIRAGFSVPFEEHDWLSIVALYGIAGFLPAYTESGPQTRVGVGFSIPPLAAAYAQAGTMGPTYVELTSDFGPEETVWSVRLGLGLH
jgi:hypothetical protein